MGIDGTTFEYPLTMTTLADPSPGDLVTNTGDADRRGFADGTLDEA